jgi:preprotein translocase subunit YajC
LGSSTVYWIIMIVLFVAIFYFMLMRPQQKQRRAHQELMASLKKGDVVMTAAGIYGMVKRVDESVVVIEIAKGVTIKVVRRAIADIVKDSAQARAVAPEGTSTSRGRRSPRASEESYYEGAGTDENGLEPGDDQAEDDSDK